MSQVTIITGSISAENKLNDLIDTLLGAQVDIETRILPTTCPPLDLQKYVSKSEGDVFIVGSDRADLLTKYVAAFTDQPVIGIHIDKSAAAQEDLDLFNTRGMPTGVPRMIVDLDYVDRAINLALRILNIHQPLQSAGF